MRLLLFFILITLLLSADTKAQDTAVVRYNVSENYPDPNQQYHIDLLKLVLDASRHKHGEYELVPGKVGMLQGRASLMIKKGEIIDIMWE